MSTFLIFFRRRPTLITAIAVSSGIIIERYVEFPLWWLIAIIVLLMTCQFLFDGLIRILILFFSCLLLGASLFNVHYLLLPENHISWLIAPLESVTLKGWVRDQHPTPSGSTRYIVAVQKYKADSVWYDLQGDILITVPGVNNKFNYGHGVQLSGILHLPRTQRNPGEMDYRRYLSYRKIYGLMEIKQDRIIFDGSPRYGTWFNRTIVFPLKEKLTRAIYQHFTTPEKDVLIALILGEQGSIPSDIQADFTQTGAVHLLAVSGQHVIYIILILTLTASILRLWGWRRAAFIISGLILYTFLTGATASVVRAAILGGIVTLAFFQERRTDVWNSLGTAGLILLLIRPGDIFVIGFQLSFAAVIALIISGDLLKKYLPPPGVGFSYHRKIIYRYIISAFLISLFVSIILWPMTGYYFHRISLSIIVLNLLLIPLSAVIVGVGFFALILGQFIPTLAVPFYNTLDFFLHILVKTVSISNTLPFSSLTISHWGLRMLIAVICLVMIGFLLWKINRLRYVIFFIIGTANVWICYGIFFPPTPGLDVLYFDVGQGNAVLISLPDQKKIMIDTGDIQGSLTRPRSSVVEYCIREGIKKLDMVLISHPDRDHMGGLFPLLSSIKIGSLCLGPAQEESQLAQETIKKAVQRNVQVRRIYAGDSVLCGKGYRFYSVHPTRAWIANNSTVSINDQSLIIKVVFGENSFLFPGDAEFPAEQGALRFPQFLIANVLLAGHHGSFTSSSDSFLAVVHPSFAVISVGERNRYGHPSPLVLERLARVKSQIIRTDETGACRFFTDGRRLVRMR